MARIWAGLMAFVMFFVGLFVPTPPQRPVEPPYDPYAHPFSNVLVSIKANAVGGVYAFLIDLDDDGTQGMLVISYVQTSMANPVARARFFAMYNGELQTLASQQFEGFGSVTFITAHNRVASAWGAWEWGYSILGMENGQLAFTTLLHVTRDSYDNSVFPDNFDEIRERYGLGSFTGAGWWRTRPNHNAEILAMTIQP